MNQQTQNYQEHELLQCLEAHNIGTDYNDNPLTTMNIHSKYYNDEKFDDLKTHITDINSHNQLVALHLNIQSLPSKFEALEELINTSRWGILSPILGKIANPRIINAYPVSFRIICC